MLIDSEKLKQAILTFMPERSEVLFIVCNQPEGIVRCKDCKRWTSPIFGYKNAQVGDCRILGATHADWFCADGERR